MSHGIIKDTESYIIFQNVHLLGISKVINSVLGLFTGFNSSSDSNYTCSYGGVGVLSKDIGNVDTEMTGYSYIA